MLRIGHLLSHSVTEDQTYTENVSIVFVWFLTRSGFHVAVVVRESVIKSSRHVIVDLFGQTGDGVEFPVLSLVQTAAANSIASVITALIPSRVQISVSTNSR